MVEIDFNSIFDGLTLAMQAAFPEAKIHGEAVEQDLDLGDFTVLPITPQHVGEMGARARRNLMFDIVYYATENGGREECLTVAHILTQAIGTIVTPQGVSVHSGNVDVNIVDDVMHCIVSYPHFVYIAQMEKETMETLQSKQGV